MINQPLKIINEPGSQVIYSGGGYTLLQLIIEEVTGITFSKYMDKEVLKPLGMENSSYSDDYNKSNMSKAYGYFGQEVPNYNFTEKAAAGLKTTVSDFSKFVLANMDGYNDQVRGGNVLTNKSVDLMHIPVKSDSGLGIFSKELSDGSTFLYHGGDNRGWHSLYGFIPEKREGIVLFTNSDNGIDLRQDIYNFWLEYETGVMPQQYYAMEKSRNLNAKIVITFTVLLAVYILFFIVKLKHGKKLFVTRKGNISLVKFLIRILIPMILAGVIYFISYKMDILPLQGGLKNAVIIIFAWLLVFFVTGFFTKSKKKAKEGIIA
ncbi:beta-lactamase/D-alanine carboxypeptidase [Clostridium homopropionicum DSM 5847]|uniref:Beta-lactamase/D-alanine carboxypeptidase n=1 Tax=Clostridium homopropionicum DSM 5847 TaxID=1121318 RepID=A0A0L6Z537_9CLOT|nr:beta-lactamase/D-alanine carboxypeptidase [Clostridium homopropionicum DSM 5847]SFG71310.1 Beta-lactamase [Clostridium homopropionicum]